MLRPYISALAISAMSAIGSEALACIPEGLERNFSSQKDEEAQWQEFVIDEQCKVLVANPSDAEAVEKLRKQFAKGHVGNSVALGTIDGCSAEQVLEAAC